MIVFRHCDSRSPFCWDMSSGHKQPEGRWNRTAGGPATCFADTPDGAWAEFLRHEEIREVEDLQFIRRAMWAVEIPNVEPARVFDVERHVANPEVLVGGKETYGECQRIAEAARTSEKYDLLVAPSAALRDGAARGWQVDEGQIVPGPNRSAKVYVLLDRIRECVGWRIVDRGAPPSRLLDESNVRYLGVDIDELDTASVTTTRK